MLELVVIEKRVVAAGIVELRLRGRAGEQLPRWTPGAHVDVLCMPGITRQYSVCGDPENLTEYRIAVLRERVSRGGSVAIHEKVQRGDVLSVSAPRNHFELQDAQEYLFIAGGIGITPIIPMIREANRKSRAWRLLYGGRTRDSMAFRGELEGDERVVFVPQDEHGLLDVRGYLTRLPATALIYCCGPEPLLAAAEAACETAGVRQALRVERFAPKDRAEGTALGFEVELAGSRKRLYVAPDRSLLQVLRDDAGIDVFTSCEEGTCGTCETGVLAGIPDHWDSVLTDEEREAGDRMMVCVSRSRTPLLTLDV